MPTTHPTAPASARGCLKPHLRRLLVGLVFAGCATAASLTAALVQAERRPNIVWIIVEDMSSDFGYQGQTLVRTPNVDRLAKEGVVFGNAYVSIPVCSPRSPIASSGRIMAGGRTL